MFVVVSNGFCVCWCLNLLMSDFACWLCLLVFGFAGVPLCQCLIASTGVCVSSHLMQNNTFVWLLLNVGIWASVE